MRRWWLVLALLLSLGINLGMVAVIVVQRLRPPLPPVSTFPEVRPGVELLANRMGLDGASRERFLDLQQRFFEATRGGRERMAGLNRDLRRELARPQPDRERVDRLLGESAVAFRDLERSLADSVLATRALLTPEQDRLYLRFLDRIRPGSAPLGRRPLRPFGGRRRPMIESPPGDR